MARYLWREAVVTGGLASGELPVNLPVRQSTRTELIINLKIAKALGLTFPVRLLGCADEVIEYRALRLRVW